MHTKSNFSKIKRKNYNDCIKNDNEFLKPIDVLQHFFQVHKIQIKSTTKSLIIENNNKIIHLHVPPQFPRDWLQVHEIAESGSRAFSHLVLTAAGFSEVRDGTELRVNWTTPEPTIVQIVYGTFGILFFTKLQMCLLDKIICNLRFCVLTLSISHIFNKSPDTEYCPVLQKVF